MKRTRLTQILSVLGFWLALAGAIQAAEIARLDEKNWGSGPGGGEVDAIYGDYLLQNDLLAATVAATPTTCPIKGNTMFRMGNTALPDARGLLLDLTMRSDNNDQLMAFYPGGAAADQVAFDQSAIVQASGPEARLRVTHNPTPKQPFLIEAEYVVADGKPYIAVTTRLKNTGGAPLKTSFGDRLRALGNFGQAPGRTPDVYEAYDKWHQAAYAVLSKSGHIAPAKVTGFYTMGTQLLYPEATGGEKAALAPGQEVTWTCWLVAGHDLLDVEARLLALEGAPTATAKVIVTEEDGAPVRGALLTVRNGATQIAAGQTDEKGRAAIVLPPAAYTLVVSADGRTSQNLALDLAANGPTREVAIKMEPASGVDATITGEDGNPLPCKTQYLAVGKGKADPEFGPGCLTHGVRNCYYTENGRFRLAMAPGEYDVVISRGPEYDAVTRRMEVKPREFTEVKAVLKRTVDTRGFISADFHSHTTESGDNFSEVTGRVLNLAAEDVQFAPSTDHQRLTDYKPVIKQLGLEPWLCTVAGEEISGPGGGGMHENAFPLIRHAHEQDNGGVPAGGGLDAQSTRIYEWDNRSEKVIQLNHPDIRKDFFDKDGDGNLDGGFKIAAKLYNAIEAKGNPLGASRRGGGGQVSGWLAVLNQGYRITGVANTDTHTTFHGSGGVRNYIPCSTDDPAKIDPMEIVRQIKAGHVVMSAGPFMVVTCGKATPGDDVAASDGKVTLHVKVQCPNWMDINRVQVMANGKPLPECNFTREKQPQMFGDKVVKFDQDIPVALKGDANLVVVAVGEGLMLAPVMGGRGGKGEPLAVSNPFYVDVDGGGFKANGDSLGIMKAAADKAAAEE